MQIRIEQATFEDAEAMHTVRRASVDGICRRHYPDPSVLDHFYRNQTVDKLRTSITDSLCYTLVARDGPTIIGFGQLHLGGTNAILTLLYLLPGHAGRGIGKTLCEHLFGEARRRGVDTIRTESTLNAVSFYGRLGFINQGPGACDHTCFNMTLSLSHSA